MRIFQTQGQDVTLLDSRAALGRIHDRLNAFLSSPDAEIRLAGEQDGSALPGQRFLHGLVVRKAPGAVVLALAADGWLELSGAQEHLRLYVSHFHFEADQERGHHHPEYEHVEGYLSPSTLSLVIEADPDG